jgi:hypothetical protein
VRLYAEINGRIDRELLKARQQAEFNRRSFGQWLRWKRKEMSDAITAKSAAKTLADMAAARWRDGEHQLSATRRRAR